jgi:hydroxyacylglutathione hydrolase
MTQIVKRSLTAVGGLVLLVGLVLVFGLSEMFLGLRPVEDGREINGIRIVADGFTTISVVPIGDGEVALIDAGMDASGEAILAELARRGLGPAAVTAILITHGHGDHTGALGVFRGAEVIALEAEMSLIDAERGRSVRDGEVVTLGDATVRVYAMPGHTPGSAAYLVNGVLFLGDSAQVESSGTLRPAPWLVTDDRAQNRASLVRLGAVLADEGAGVAATVPSHSGPANGISALADFARENQ